jgi:hypothetical protein
LIELWNHGSNLNSSFLCIWAPRGSVPTGSVPTGEKKLVWLIGNFCHHEKTSFHFDIIKRVDFE